MRTVIPKDNFPIYKSLLFDTDLDRLHYHFCEGNWYFIEKSYIDKLKNYLDPYFEKTTLMDFNHTSEDDYNQAVASYDSEYICLHQTSISPPNQHQVEPCDLYKAEEWKVFLLSHKNFHTISFA